MAVEASYAKRTVVQNRAGGKPPAAATRDLVWLFALCGYNCQGIKLLGGKHVLIVGNSFRVPVNCAVFIAGASGEGLRVGRNGNGSTVVELVDWFTLDIRGVDHTSAARLLPRQVTPAEIANPVETELRSF